MENEEELLKDDDMEVVTGGSEFKIMATAQYVLRCNNSKCQVIPYTTLYTYKGAQEAEKQHHVCPKCLLGFLVACKYY